MRLAIRHETSYSYGDPPLLALQRLRLGPPTGPALRIHRWDVALSGARAEARFTDGHGNRTVLAALERGEIAMRVTVTGMVETLRDDGVVGDRGDGLPPWLYRRDTALTAPGARVGRLVEAFDAGDPLASLHGLTRAVRAAIRYRIGETDAATTAEDALAHGAGVCQDHAHAFIAAARRAGLPARYVSGYLKMDDRDEQAAMHAWAEAHVPGLGWVGFDPANGHSPDARYVAVARGLDYRDAAPVAGLVRNPAASGTAGSGAAGRRAETLHVAISVSQWQSQQQSQHPSQQQ